MSGKTMLSKINLYELELKILNCFVDEKFFLVRLLSLMLIRAAHARKNSYYIAAGYGTIGYMYIEKKKYKKAIRYITKAISVSRDGDRSFIDPGHLSICYSKLGDFENSLKHVDKAIEASELLNNSSAKHDWYNYKAKVLLKMNRFDEALLLADKSIESAGKMPGMSDQSIFYYQPYLTKYEILTRLKSKPDDMIKLQKQLDGFFKTIDKPKLHIRNDKRKFIYIKNGMNAE